VRFSIKKNVAGIEADTFHNVPTAFALSVDRAPLERLDNAVLGGHSVVAPMMHLGVHFSSRFGTERMRAGLRTLSAG
jgi:hypothetical protein